MPELTPPQARPHEPGQRPGLAPPGAGTGRVGEVRLPPFAAESFALAIHAALRDSVLLIPARESVRWLVERHRTSILASRRILMSSEDWVSRVHGLSAGVPVVYLGPPPEPDVRLELRAAASQRPVHLIAQSGPGRRQAALAHGRPVADRPAGLFASTAVRRCRELVRGSCWQELRICVADDIGHELVAGLQHCARVQGVPLCTEELIGGAASPVMLLLRLAAAGDLAADSLRLAANAARHELGTDVTGELAALAAPLRAAGSVPARAALLVSTGRSVHSLCPGRELHPGLTERLLERAERTALAARSLQQWLEDVMRPRWARTGDRDGVQVVRISRGAVHAVQAVVIAREAALANPPAAAAAAAVCAGAVTYIDAGVPAAPGR